MLEQYEKVDPLDILPGDRLTWGTKYVSFIVDKIRDGDIFLVEDSGLFVETHEKYEHPHQVVNIEAELYDYDGPFVIRGLGWSVWDGDVRYQPPSGTVVDVLLKDGTVLKNKRSEVLNWDYHAMASEQMMPRMIARYRVSSE